MPDAAAQTRIVSVTGIRLNSVESVRSFKGIISDDVSEFESYHPSQPVRSFGRSEGRLHSLFVERSTPSAWTYADHAGEDPGQVTLIGEAAGQGHIRQRQSAISQLLLRHLDTVCQ
jgi:hypothetical protein